MARKTLGFMQLTIMCGFGMFYAWYLIAFFGLFAFVPSDLDFVRVHCGQVAFFAGSIAATLGIIAAFRKTNSVAIGHTRFLYLASFIPGAFMPLCITAYQFGVDIPVGVFYVACALAGASVAVGFMLWEDLSTHSKLRGGVAFHGVIFCAGGIVFLVVTLAFPIMQASIVALVLLCISTALLAFITPRCDHIENRPLEPARQYFAKTWHIDIVVATINVAFGYAFIMLYQMNTMTLIIAMGVAIFVDLLFSLAFGRGKWLEFAGWARICAACVSGALILLACRFDNVSPIALGIIVLFWFVFRTMNGGSLTDLANQHDFSALYCSTRGKLPANVGFAIGLGIGVAALASGMSDISGFYVPLALVAAFIFTALFFLPFDSESMTPGYKTLALVDMHESRETSLQDTCERAASQFKLSPRESETLEYLVRGRNAKHISEKLFISESTAKTHISNIYRKFGVHSQQELLDTIDKL